MKKTIFPLLLAIILVLAGCTATNQTSRFNDTGSYAADEDADCIIKGNISSSGEKIYHVPGGQYYSVTVVDTSNGERWFCSEADARAAGWRKSLR